MRVLAVFEYIYEYTQYKKRYVCACQEPETLIKSVCFFLIQGPQKIFILHAVR